MSQGDPGPGQPGGEAGARRSTHNWFLVRKFGQEPLRTGMLFIQHPSGEHSGCFPADTHSDPARAHAGAEGSLSRGVTCQCPVQLNPLHDPPFPHLMIIIIIRTVTIILYAVLIISNILTC